MRGGSSARVSSSASSGLTDWSQVDILGFAVEICQFGSRKGQLSLNDLARSHQIVESLMVSPNRLRQRQGVVLGGSTVQCAVSTGVVPECEGRKGASGAGGGLAPPRVAELGRARVAGHRLLPV